MFVASMIKSMILSLLRPYLPDPPGIDLDLRLGPITSVATARNLRLDPSAINGLVAGVSYDFAFKSVTIEELTLVFSAWASHAIEVTVRGVRVVVSVGESEERYTRTARAMDDAISEDLGKRLSAVDPEGYVLHEALQNLLSSLTLRGNIGSAFVNLIYNHCQLHVMDVHLDLEFPVLGDCISWFSVFEELSLVSRHHKQGCILRGLAGLMLVPSRDCSFMATCSGFYVGYNRNSQTNRTLSCKEFKISAVLKDLSLSNFDFQTPEISLSCSPADVAFVLNSNRALSREGNHGKRSSQLWKLAARRIRELYFLPRYSLHKLFRVLILWLRYVSAYESLLLLIGYPDRNLLRRSCLKISQRRTFKNDVQNYWKTIITLEKDLPPNAIAQAWRVARHRASMAELVQLSFSDLHLYQKILAVITKCLNFIWYIIFNVLYIWRFCFRKPSPRGSKYKFWFDTSADGSGQKKSFSFQIGKAVLSFCKINKVCSSVSTSVESHTGISYADFLSFHVVIGAASVKCVEEIFEQSLMICCGKLTVSTAPTEGTASEASASSQSLKNKNGHRQLRIKPETIICCDPADLLAYSEYCAVEVGSSNLKCDESYVMNFMRVFWEGWQKEYGTLVDSDAGRSENPFLLCEVSKHVSSPDPKFSSSGFWKCSLLVGKIHMAFERFSMILLALLFGQTETVLEHAFPNISTGSLDVQDVPWNRKYQSFADKTSSAVFKLFPENHIQVTAFIAGPRIRIPLDKGEMVSDSDDWNFSPPHLVFDFHDLEVVLSPECELNKEMQSELEAHGHTGQCAMMTGIPEFCILSAQAARYTAHKFLSHNLCMRANGLTVSLDESVGKQVIKTFVLGPTKCQLSYQREGLYAFGSMVDALSVSFCGATSLIGLLFMDEISLVIQLILDLSSVISCSMCNACVGCFQTGKLKEIMKQDQMDFEGYGTTFEGSLNAGKELQYLLRGSFRINSIDISLQKTRSYRSNMQGFDAARHNEQNFYDSGIWISAEPFCFDMRSNYEKTEVYADLSGVHSLIFISHVNIDSFFDNPQSRIATQQSLDCLAEAYLSNSIVACELGCQKFTAESDLSYSSNLMQKLQFPSSMVMSVLDRWILINISVGEIFVGKPSVKDTLLGAHQMNKFFSSLSIGGEFHIISWKMQGGILMIETGALAVFLDYYASFLHHAQYVFKMASKDVEKTEETASASHDSRQNGIFPEVLNFDMSQFSLIIAVAEQSGLIRELIVEVDITLNCERTRTSEKLLGNFSRLSILSQVVHRETADETKVRFVPSDMTAQEISGNPDTIYAVKERVGWGRDATLLQDIASSSRSEFINTTHKKFILEHFIASMQVEKTNCGDDDSNCAWLGQCSLSGVDMTLSLSDILVIIDVLESRSGLLQEEVMSKPGPEPPHLSSNQEPEKSFEASILDGAIVAIQDVDEHMYFAAEGRGGKSYLVGSFHYSLVGKQALFRVKYHSQRISRSSTVWFSLISLYAKDLSGKPLALAYRRGSGFVEFSGNYSSSWALWRAVSCKTHSSEGFVLRKEYDQLFKGTFYLENKKSGCAVAIVNGVPEFVHNPGNAFKFKVFKNSDVPYDPTTLSPSNPSASGKSPQRNDDIEMKRKPFPCVDVQVEDISVTLVYELLHVEHVFTLIQGRVGDIKLMVHGLPAKVRIIATCRALLDCYEAQKNKWRELLRPVEIKIYYRTRLPIHGHVANLGAPVYLFCKAEELHFSLTEKSMDTLLFIVGKLNISGPYEVKEGSILSNCCKVENRTGASLLCKFYDQQSVKIAGNHATSVYPRYQASESTPVVSLQLAFSSSYSTSTVDVSLLEGRSLAWRTRIVSLQDSRTYPGPFLLVDIDRYSEDGISIVASPLVKIHNETDVSMELRFQRPQLEKDEFASILLRSGGTMDDTTTMFDSINLSGGVKKAMTSLSVGNFLFSFRPKFHEAITESRSSLLADWSGNINGGKAVRLSGIFNKLSYRVRRAFWGKSVKVSTSTAACAVKSSDALVENLHFLIQSYERGVPVIQINNVKEGDGGDAPIVLQEQKEIFLLPTVRVCNLLLSEIHVLLIDDPNRDSGCHSMGNQATISSGSTTNFYADPAKLYFVVTLTAFSSRCKTVNSGDWVKKLRGKEIGYLDIDLDFAGGKYFATLRLSRSHTGILQAYIFTPHSLKNETDLPLLIHVPHQRNLPRPEERKVGLSVTPDIGLVLAPKSSGSWLLKLTKVQVTLLEDDSLKTLLDLGSLSGLSEIRLEMMGGQELKPVMKFGVHAGPAFGNLDVPAQCITLVPRHVIVNNSERSVIVRQLFLQDDMAGITTVPSRERAILPLRSVINERRRYNLVENLIRKHQNIKDDMLFVQLHLDDPGYGWSGPICIASLGSFFVKFKRQEDQLAETHNTKLEFAHIHVIEEGSSLVLLFHSPPSVKLPYKIENQLPDFLLTYYQKDSSYPEILPPKSTVDYVWDDVTLPRKLVVQINDLDLIREINLDKLREWKPFYKERRYRGISSQLFSDRKSGNDENKFIAYEDMAKLGYEVYADGPTRVLRICESFNSCRKNLPFHSSEKIRVRIPHFVGNLVETKMTEGSEPEETAYTPLVSANVANICFDAIFSDQQRYMQTTVQALNVDPKWTGAPFASIIRKHYSSNSYTNHCMLKVVAVMESSFSGVRHVKHLSIVLQPVDVNLDEETLMRIAPFWRSSLSETNTKSQQYYFDHFEIHPVKITANFLPGDTYSSYSSAQETLRSLIHSVVKIPPIKNMAVELNGVLITHALITLRELSIRCAQHYSWYAMRAIYLAKGSPLLPPGFASMFDDLASSSLDVFFDPSQGLLKLPGFTSNAFKLIRKSLGKEGYMGTRRYLGDLGKTLKSAGSNVLFAAATELSDSVLKGAESSGFDGMINGFHQGILKLAMEPSVLGSALLEGGPERIIILDQSPGVDELYIEGYLQAMLDSIYKQEYLRVRVVDNQVFLKNLPPNNALIEEIMDRVRGFLVSRALLKGYPSTSRPLRHLRGESEWKIGPTVITLCEHLFVSFAIRALRNQASKLISKVKQSEPEQRDADRAKAEADHNPVESEQKQNDNKGKDIIVPADNKERQKAGLVWRWGIGRFVISGVLAYIDGRLCRCIPNPIVRRIVSGFVLSFLDRNDSK